ncbi:hypothetical protein GNF10_21795 [Nostoc sp. UCD121]|uniref:hypothetical protein n=1 Tax=unclassified Nostoc TaxID=2593658 RepID=UPI00162598E0|nr:MULTISPECIES: hypothetical protein [unclassified Nostoc]MBC1221614.1 hypothetical protein [Nostoc sp. UCD120]MBC1278526.1 hypothetical protein [Nostoc sp. UCD121]MBC1294266.1 hypothetical protein [Nostoc sp. UCD122]
MLFSNSKTNLKTRQNNKIGRVFWTPTNVLILTGYLIILPICTLTTLSLFTASLFASIGTSHYSTSIPWIDDASECEYTGRKWRDRKCWDNQHNPMF